MRCDEQGASPRSDGAMPDVSRYIHSRTIPALADYDRELVQRGDFTRFADVRAEIKVRLS